MPDLEAARLRLAPSDGELACPKKGGAQIAVGRCREWQTENACTCDVARARGCAIDGSAVQTPPPPAPGGFEAFRARKEAERALRLVEEPAKKPDRRRLLFERAQARRRNQETTMVKEKPAAPDGTWLSADQIADEMKVSAAAVTLWWKQGKLGKERRKAPGKGGASLYPRAAVEEWKKLRAAGAALKPARPVTAKGLVPARAAKVARRPPPHGRGATRAA